MIYDIPSEVSDIADLSIPPTSASDFLLHDNLSDNVSSFAPSNIRSPEVIYVTGHHARLIPIIKYIKSLGEENGGNPVSLKSIRRKHFRVKRPDVYGRKLKTISRVINTALSERFIVPVGEEKKHVALLANACYVLGDRGLYSDPEAQAVEEDGAEQDSFTDEALGLDKFPGSDELSAPEGVTATSDVSSSPFETSNTSEAPVTAKAQEISTA